MTLTTTDRRQQAECEDPAALSTQLAEAEATIVNLNYALKNSRTIGAAIGILMEREHLDEDAAFERLTVVSQQTNRKLREIAASLVYSGLLPDPAEAQD